MKDKFEREINYLRLSITDRCNLRCIYCIGEKHIEFLPKNELLTLDEIIKIVKSFANLGIKKVRITGGEPLIRPDFPDILKNIKKIPGIEDVSITTNGINLAEHLEFLEEMKVKSINISLDTLKPDLYSQLTGGGDIFRVFNSLFKVIENKISNVKINVVVIKGKNEDEILDFVELAKNYPIDIRFIELMPLGLGKQFEEFSNEEIKKIIAKKYRLESVKEINGFGPAIYYKVKSFKGKIGFINPLSHNFCNSCNRIRITSDGFLKLCLHSDKGISLKEILRNNKNINLEDIIIKQIYKKPEKHLFNKYNEKDSFSVETRLMNKIGG